MKYEELFSLFVSTDDLRPELNKPFKQNGGYYATDAHALIYMPIWDLDLPYLEQEKPNCSKIMPNISMDAKFNLSDIKSHKDVELVEEVLYETIKCNICDGDGYITCNLGHNHDCKHCDGEGYYTKMIKKTGKLILPDRTMGLNYLYKIAGVLFKPHEVNRLAKACEILNENTITKLAGESSMGNLFKVGEAFILIMPNTLPYDELIINLVD